MYMPFKNLFSVLMVVSLSNFFTSLFGVSNLIIPINDCNHTFLYIKNDKRCYMITVVIVLSIAWLIEKVYRKIDLTMYSPRWEYFFKAMLYGFIAILTLLYGKDSINDVSMLEWAIVAVSGIEGIGNYINYVKESEKRKRKQVEFDAPSSISIKEGK